MTRTDWRRASRAAAMACALGLLAGPAVAVTAITSGSVDDGPAAVLRRSDGSVLVVFSRGFLVGGVEMERGLYRMRSDDGGRTFSAPASLRDQLGAREDHPALLETPAGVTYLYFVSDVTGVAAIHVANTADGESWSFSPFPLDVGLPLGEAVSRPTAAWIPPGDALLAFERTLDTTIHLIRLAGFASPQVPPSAIGVGVEPHLLHHPEDFWLLARRSDVDPGAVILGLSTDSGGAWTFLQVLAAPEPVHAPRLLAHPSGAVSLVVGQRPAPGSGRVLRALSTVSPVFGPPDLVPMPAADVQFPFPVIDDPDGSDGISLYVSLVDTGAGSGEQHLARATTGACDARPEFAGVQAVKPVDPCEPMGLDVSWSAPASWGSANAGIFDVHRSTTPGFEPDLDTRLGVTPDLTWTDWTAAPDLTYHYLVLAVGLEACRELSGGAVRGLDDGNRVRLAGVDPSAQPPPSVVTGLRLTRGTSPVAAAMTWADVPGSIGYLVAAATTPEPTGFTDLTPAPTPHPYLLDADGAPITHYLVRAVDECGREGPLRLP